MVVQIQINAVIRHIKIDLDLLGIAAREIDRGPGGCEVSLAKTKLQESLHWLIDALDEIKAAQSCSKCNLPKEKCVCLFDVPS
jgi:hypothetical protein